MTRIPQELTEAYSKGTLSRRDIGERLGRPVGFGELLASLHERKLRLPRHPSDPNSPGVHMIQRLSARGRPVTEELVAKLIVMNTGPLITLAAADNLDYLLYPGVPIYVPDAVLYEATRDSAALGAAEILAWAQKNSEQVRTISTEAFFNYVESREANPARREKDLGERAAIEAIHDGIHLAPEERAVPVTEDDRVLRCL